MGTNAQLPFITVELTLFGGLFTEATPEALPNGAGNLAINVDFEVGALLPRPGLENEFYYANNSIEKLAAFAQSIANGHPGNEQAWSNPTNATLDSPGTYAECDLNTPTVSQSGIGAFESSTANAGTSTTNVSTGSLTPQTPPEIALFFESSFYSITPAAGWSNFDISSSPCDTFAQIVNGIIAGTGTLSNNGQYAAGLALFKLLGNSIPTHVQAAGFVSGSVTAGSYSQHFNNPIAAGNTIIVFGGAGEHGSPVISSVTDTLGNTYSGLIEVASGSAIQDSGVSVWICQNCKGGSPTVTVHTTNSVANAALMMMEVQGGIYGPNTPGFGQILKALNFGYSIPSTQNILGAQVVISGHQSTQNSDAVLTVSIGNASGQSTQTFDVQLPSVDGSVTIATPLTKWGFDLTPDFVNDPNFNVEVLPSATTSEVSFRVYAIEVIVWTTPNPPPSFNYLKTFSETGGEILNLALGSDGNMYQEDAVNAPGALTVAYDAIEPNSFAQSCTTDDREFIAISNLINGTDIPYTYTPPNFDRLSQVGPGAPCSATPTSAGSQILSITQQAVVHIPTSTGGTSGAWILWSNSPLDNGAFGAPATPGNVFTLVFPRAFPVPSYLNVGDSIILSGVQTMNGYNPNNSLAPSDPNPNNPSYYTITSIGQPPPGEQYYDAITVTLPQTGFFNSRLQAGGTIQATKATMTTAQQVPNLEVGSQFQIAGTGGAPPAGYDGTQTVLETPNASQLLITATELVSNVATYSYVLESGTAPVVGQYVTVAQTLNGNGVFNVTNAVISGASAGTFSINIVNPDVSSSAENGSGIIFGTIFTFDPFAIVGTKNTGTVVTVGVIGAGTRKVCYSFLTRNGYITQPSPITTFTVAEGASAIVISNLLPGPSNVIARIIHLTAADGGNFYNIPEDVSVTDNGVTVINTSTYVNDNTTTSVKISFSDSVLLAATEIDVEGENLFECAELGSLTMLIPYAQRVFAIGEQNKITNLLNWSFDGGIQVTQGNAGAGGGSGTNATYPAGWTLDPVNGGGAAVVNSPLFGFAYQISNQSGSLQATYGMISQGAYQDEFQVAIIEPSTTYSVRVTCEVPSGASGGDLVVDLYNPAISRAVGTFSLALSGIASSMAIYTGTLLTTVLAPVPNGLLLRVWAQNIPNGVTVNIDRVEVFPTEEPNLSGQITGSYQGDFESFDQVSGVVNCSVQNQQPVKSAFTLFDSLYIVKTGSFLQVTDNKTTEPSEWAEPRVISNAVGTTSVYGVSTGVDQPNSGEEWALIAGRAGLYIFNGGEPIKLSEEIQKLWNYIYWANGHLLWLLNDIINRRILVGVPLITPNPWLPTGIIPDNATPAYVNSILELNYKQLNTAGLLAERIGVRTSYSAKLIASEITRKWAIWTVRAPCGAFLTRDDGTAPPFVGNSAATGKIYEFIDGLFEDDGSAFAQKYRTFGFVQGETGQQTQMGMVRYNYDFATMIVDGSGSFTITVYPNNVNDNNPYTHDLLPNLTLPLMTNGDIEVPVNENASRLFFMFSANAVGAGYTISRLIVAMHQDPWSPVRGRND